MNERIKELAERCGFRSNPDVYDRNQSFDISKFAELIVKECAGLFPNVYVSIETEHGHTPVIAANYIKEHFGVEE